MILYCETDGLRLDVFLTDAVPGLSRSAAQRLLEEGAVTREGKPQKKNARPGPAMW